MDNDRTIRLKESSNNQAAWDQWFREVYPRVYYVLFRKSFGDSSRTEDLVCGAIERFIRYEGLKKVKSDKDSVAYLIRTGIRLLTDEIMSGERETKAVEETPGNESAPQNDERLDMESLLNTLNEEDQALISMVREGHSVSEISNSLSISYSAAGTRISRIREKLRKSAIKM